MVTIQVSSSSGGPTNFNCAVNPHIYDPEDSTPVSEFSVLHGPSIWQKQAFDARPRTLTWPGYLVTSSFVTGLATYFRSIEGKIRYFNFNDINNMNTRWPSSSTWKKARIIKCEFKYKPGGLLTYENFSVIIQPEQ